MKMTVYPSSPLRGSPSMPGDKSLSHRAVLLAAMAGGNSRIGNLQVSGVTVKMLEAVRRFGVEWELKDHTLDLSSPGIGGWQSSIQPIDCGNSATTLRLLAGALAASGLAAVLDGSVGLRRRPMDRILEPLQSMGAPIHGTLGNYAPVELEARSPSRKLCAMEYSLPIASAQVKSCLLLAALAADGPVILREPAPSRDHTERMLQYMGANLETTNDEHGRQIILYPAPAPLSPLRLDLPGDLSSAAFLIVAGLIVPGSQITIRNVGLNPGRTGLLDALIEMGADIQVSCKGEQAGEPYGDVTVRHSILHAVEISGDRVVRMIDEFPIFAVAAAFAIGKTLVKDALELRYKESDRIACLCQELGSLGCDITELPAGFMIAGSNRLRPTAVHTHGDHRLAMALAVVGLAGTGPMTIHDAQIVRESYPEFGAHLAQLGARLDFDEDNDA